MSNQVSKTHNVCTDIAYGPVHSRRFGISLGLNISGSGKYCSFNCIYCFRGNNDGSPDTAEFRANLPSVEYVLDSLEKWINAPHDKIDEHHTGRKCRTYKSP